MSLLLPILNFGLSLGMLPILSRGYTPEMWGEWSLFSIVGSTVGALCTLRLENVFYRVSLSSVLEKIANILVLIVCVIHAFLLFLVFAMEGIGLVLVSVLVSFNVAYTSILIAYYLRLGKQGHYCLAVLSLSAIPLTLNVLVSLVWGFKEISFVFSYAVTLAMLLFVSFSLIRPSALTRSQGLTLFKRILRRGHYQLRYTWPQTIVNLLRLRMVYAFMGLNVSSSYIAAYSLTERVSNALSGAIAQALRPIYVSGTLKTHGKLTPRLKLLLLFIVASSLIMSVLFYNFNLLPFVFGDEYEDTDHIWRLLLLQGVAAAFFNWGDKIFELSNKQKINFYTEFVFSLLLIVLFLINLGHNFFSGHELVSVVIKLQLFAYLVWSYFAIRFAWNAWFSAIIVASYAVCFYILIGWF